MSTRRRTPRSDGESTRARILEVAGRLFAQHGYANTASKAICEEAGADLAAINYHFGSRDALYKAVLVEGHKQFVSLHDLRELADSALPPETKLERFINAIVSRLLDDRSWQSKVCAREILAPTAHFASLIREEVMPKFEALERIIGEITGLPRHDPALSRCVISIIAPCLMLMVIDRDQSSPMQAILLHDADALKNHLNLFARSGLEAIRRHHDPPDAAQSVTTAHETALLAASAERIRAMAWTPLSLRKNARPVGRHARTARCCSAAIPPSDRRGRFDLDLPPGRSARSPAAAAPGSHGSRPARYPPG